MKLVWVLGWFFVLGGFAPAVAASRAHQGLGVDSLLPVQDVEEAVAGNAARDQCLGDVILGSSSGNSSYFPINGAYNYSRCMTLIRRSEFTCDPYKITHLAVNVYTASTMEITNMTVWMKKTTATNVTTSWDTTGATQVYGPTTVVFSPTGWKTLDFIDFVWDSDNLLIYWQWNGTASTSEPHFRRTLSLGLATAYGYSNFGWPTSYTVTQYQPWYTFTFEALPGACCFGDGHCEMSTIIEPGDCAAGGTYLGDGTDCDPNPCPQPGACCFVDGHCEMSTVVEPGDCAPGGTYRGNETNCNSNPCPQPGACCFADGHCEMSSVTAPGGCAGGGTYLGDDTVCEPSPCAQPGACCFTDGHCAMSTIVAPGDCAPGGTYMGNGTNCDSSPCPQPGACCFDDGHCEMSTIVDPGDCAPSGTYRGDGTDCAPNVCWPCAGDLNCDGVVDFGDINAFVMILSNYMLWEQTYPGCPWQNGDVDGNLSLGLEDINPFVGLMVQSPIACE